MSSCVTGGSRTLKKRGKGERRRRVGHWDGVLSPLPIVGKVWERDCVFQHSGVLLLNFIFTRYYGGMSVCCTAGPIVRHRGQWMAA